MSTPGKQDTSKLLLALLVSFLFHTSLFAAYLAFPFLRSLLFAPPPSPPAFEFGLGLPEFIDISEDPGDPGEENPEPPKEETQEEPPKEEPPQEEPPKVTVRPPPSHDPKHTYIVPASGPTSEPASEPTSLASAEPASGPTSKRFGVPLQPTALVDTLPTNAKMMILLGTEPMRKSPRKNVLGAALRNMYDVERTFGRLGLDPLDDVDEILVGTSNPWDLARWSFVIKYRGSEEELRARMEKAAQKDKDSFLWKDLYGVPIAERAKDAKHSDHYAFALIAPGVMAIAPPPVLEEFLLPRRASSSQPGSAPTSAPTRPKPPVRSVAAAVDGERGTAPAILFAASDIKRILPIGAISSYASGGIFSIDWGESRSIMLNELTLPKAPLYFRAGFEVGEGALSSFEARFETEADAADAARKFPNVRGWLARFSPEELRPIIERLDFYQVGKSIHADLEIAPEEVARILKGLSPLLMGGLVVPVEGDLGDAGLSPTPPKEEPAPETPTPTPSNPLP